MGPIPTPESSPLDSHLLGAPKHRKLETKMLYKTLNKCCVWLRILNLFTVYKSCLLSLSLGVTLPQNHLFPDSQQHRIVLPVFTLHTVDRTGWTLSYLASLTHHYVSEIHP